MQCFVSIWLILLLDFDCPWPCFDFLTTLTLIQTSTHFLEGPAWSSASTEPFSNSNSKLVTTKVLQTKRAWHGRFIAWRKVLGFLMFFMLFKFTIATLWGLGIGWPMRLHMGATALDFWKHSKVTKQMQKWLE